jgi:hypothetical protein
MDKYLEFMFDIYTVPEKEFSGRNRNPGHTLHYKQNNEFVLLNLP